MPSPKFAAMLVVKALVSLAALLPVWISAASAQKAAADKFVHIGSVSHEQMSVRALAFDPDDAFLWAQTAYGLTATRVSRFSIASETETFSFALDAELAGPPILFDMDTGSVVRRDTKGFERIALDTGKRLWRYDTKEPFDGFSIPVLSSDGKQALYVQLAGEFATLYDLESRNLSGSITARNCSPIWRRICPGSMRLPSAATTEAMCLRRLTPFISSPLPATSSGSTRKTRY